MPDVRDARSIISEAEQAAAAGDSAKAEALLREAADVQEAELGPNHPDLANTLNNLGVVCETDNKPDDAESFYRRAYGIARASLPADHPFVATSRQNLREFCQARGRPFEEPKLAAPPKPLAASKQVPSTPAALLPPPPAAPLPPTRPTIAVASQPISRGAPAAPSPAPDSTPAAASPARSSRPIAIGAAIVGALALILFAATCPWSQANERTAAPTAGDTQTQPAAPAPDPTVPAPAATPPPAREPAPGPPAASTVEPSSRPAGPLPIVASALLCTKLARQESRETPGDWQCDPAGDTVAPGQLTFYTRIQSPRDTTVQHRWHRGKALVQAVTLQVGAKGSGYRTFSRQTVTAATAGEWRVELRAADGTLMHEERFVVR